jgi:CheY-like chemotaxis protein
MKLLVATSYYQIADKLKDKLCATNSAFELTIVDTIDELTKELKKDNHHAIVAEYSIDGYDIWRVAKLVNSTQLAAHSLPIYLASETFDTEIPPILAKEHNFKVVKLEEIEAILAENQQNNLATGYQRGARPPSKPTLLIIEDDEDAAIIAQHALRGNYEIDHAETGEAGLELWQNKRHELIVLDYMLPGINGDKVLENVLKTDPNQPVIIVTAHDRSDRNKRMILNGASEYLSKPYSLDSIRAQCDAVLRRAHLIYQAQYIEAKHDSLRKMLWTLDGALMHNQIDHAKQVMKQIKAIFPALITEDEQADLTDSEV